MTMIRGVGQTLYVAGVDLSGESFSRGKLYEILSCITSKQDLFVLTSGGKTTTRRSYTISVKYFGGKFKIDPLRNRDGSLVINKPHICFQVENNTLSPVSRRVRALLPPDVFIKARAGRKALIKCLFKTRHVRGLVSRIR